MLELRIRIYDAFLQGISKQTRVNERAKLPGSGHQGQLCSTLSRKPQIWSEGEWLMECYGWIWFDWVFHINHHFTLHVRIAMNVPYFSVINHPFWDPPICGNPHVLLKGKGLMHETSVQMHLGEPL